MTKKLTGCKTLLGESDLILINEPSSKLKLAAVKAI